MEQGDCLASLDVHAVWRLECTCRAGDKLVNANEDFNDVFNNVPQELFSTNDLYELRLVGGDLQLFSSYEGGPDKQYWSLKRTLFKGDLSKVAYAGKNVI